MTEEEFQTRMTAEVTEKLREWFIKSRIEEEVFDEHIPGNVEQFAMWLASVAAL